MLCNFFPPCGCKFGSPALIVEPLHATVQEPHEALASYVSSLAMSVWTPHSPPNLNLAYRQQEWSRIRRTKKQVENWLQGVTSWIVVHATTTVVYYTVVIVSVIVMVVVIVIVHVMVDVALSPPMVVVTAIVSSSSSPPHPCKDMDARDPRKSAASQCR